MKISPSPYIKTIIEAFEKKHIVEALPYEKLTTSKLKKLEPVTDIDGNIITHPMNNPNSRLVDSTPYEDCFERMSFEHEPEQQIFEDFWRDNEMYQHKLDYKSTINEQYSYDDIPLDPRIANENFAKYNDKIVSRYGLDTDLSYDSKVKLKLIEFKESIVPSSFNRKIKLEYETISQYAQAAINAWENGVSVNELIRLMGKSVLKGNDIEPQKTNVELFKFLTKYPNERSVVVRKLKSGTEIYDNPAAIYYNIFTKKCFSSKQTIKQVLNECKTTDKEVVPTVNLKMCEIAAFLRHRSAHGMPAKTLNGKPVYYCPKETPWGKEESELLSRIKPHGHLDENYYYAAKSLLRDDKQTIQYTLANIDELAKKEKSLNEILTKYNEVYRSTNAAAREQMSSVLRKILANGRKSPEKLSEVGDIFDTVKLLQNKNININITLSAMRMIETLSSDGKSDFKYLIKLLQSAASKTSIEQKNMEQIIDLCKKMYYKTGNFGENEAALIDKIINNTTPNNSSYISALKRIIESEKTSRHSVIEIAETNLDEFSKFINRYEAIIKNSSVHDNTQYIVDKLLAPEFNRYMTVDKITYKDSEILNLLEDYCTKKISYTDFLEKISKNL